VNTRAPYARERLIINRAVVGIFRLWLTAHQRSKTGDALERFYVGACLYIRQAEGRSTTASAIAAAANMPRTTVLRRILTMMETGLVERRGRSYAINVEALLEKNPEFIPKVVRIVQRAARELSDLDN
jgi:hypothetical protein